MLYSAVATLVLIPKWDENRGVPPVSGTSPEPWWFTGNASLSDDEVSHPGGFYRRYRDQMEFDGYVDEYDEYS